jgi:hypothetical protein
MLTRPHGVLVTTQMLSSTAVDKDRFAFAATGEQIETVGDALRSNGFAVEILEHAAQARMRVRELVPLGAWVLTAASETLRLSGIEEDINSSGRYDAVRSAIASLDLTANAEAIRHLRSSPDVVLGSVAAVTASGSLVVASASGSQLPSYAGGAARVILIVGSQKIVPDLETAFRRVHEYALPLESERAMRAYGQPSAVNGILIINRERLEGRTTILLVKDVIGY